MTKRNFWQPNEIRCMLKIFKDLKVLYLLDQKVLPVNDVYRGVQREMNRRGFSSKNARQIQNKWSQLKSTYLCTKRNHNPEFYLNKDVEFRNEVKNLVEKQNITPSSVINTSAFLGNYPDPKIEKYEEENEPLPVPEGGNLYKQGSYRKTFWKFMQNLKSVQKDIQNEFITRQKHLLESERKLQENRNLKILNALTICTDDILKTSNFLQSKIVADLQ